MKIVDAIFIILLKFMFSTCSYTLYNLHMEAHIYKKKVTKYIIATENWKYELFIRFLINFIRKLYKNNNYCIYYSFKFIQHTQI